MIGEQITVSGIAVRPGVSKNGINYTKDALEKFTPTLNGKPFLKDHNGTVDNTIGLIAETNSNGRGVVSYAGWIKEDGTGLLEKIKDGRIKEVSIGAFAKEIVLANDDDDFYTAVGLEGMELSLTPIPAVKGTSLKQTLQQITDKKTDETVRVQPVYENVHDFREVIHEALNDDKPKKEENKKMGDEVEPKKEEPKVEEPAKEEPAKEEPKVEEPAKDEKVESSVTVKVDSSQVDEAIKKMEKLTEMRTKLKENTEEEAEPEKEKDEEVAEKASTLHGKVSKKELTEKQVEEAGIYNLEESKAGNFNLWKMPNSDGSLTSRGDE